MWKILHSIGIWKSTSRQSMHKEQTMFEKKCYFRTMSRLVPIKMKSMVMTSYVLAIIIWSILAQTNPSKLSIILKFVNKNISTNHQRGKLSTNQGRPFIFADICCCFEKKISTILSTTELKALFSRYRWEFRYLN